MNKLFLAFLLLLSELTFAQDIFQAIRDNDYSEVQELIKQDKEIVFIKDQRGNTPLHFASIINSDNQDRIIDLLIENGAKVNEANHNGDLPIHYAAFYGREKAINKLISFGTSIESKNKMGLTPLYFAFLGNKSSLVKLFVEKGADINSLDQQNNSFLILSVLNSDQELVKFFIQKGIDINHKNNRGNTALTIAKRENLVNIVDILKANGGIDPNPEIILHREYLGQEPPGMKPKVFALNFISTETGQLNAVFTPDGKEFHYSERKGMKPTLMKYTKCVDGEWTKPEIFPYSGKYDDVDQWIYPDGNKMIFCSNRPHINEQKIDHDFWISEKINGEWTKPILFDTIVSTEMEDYYPTFTKEKTLYFSSQREGRGTNNIYCARFSNGKYSKPEKMGEEINTELREFDPFISPDEDYIIFASEREGGYGFSDLYISFKKNDDSWTNAVNMGPEINTQGMEFTPMVTPDGKYLFFTRGDGIDSDIYWVDAKVIENIKNSNL